MHSTGSGRARRTSIERPASRASKGRSAAGNRAKSVVKKWSAATPISSRRRSNQNADICVICGQFLPAPPDHARAAPFCQVDLCVVSVSLRMTKDEIADILNDIALLLDLKGENNFKVRAYQNAARALEMYAGDLEAAA